MLDLYNFQFLKFVFRLLILLRVVEDLLEGQSCQLFPKIWKRAKGNRREKRLPLARSH